MPTRPTNQPVPGLLGNINSGIDSLFSSPAGRLGVGLLSTAGPHVPGTRQPLAEALQVASGLEQQHLQRQLLLERQQEAERARQESMTARENIAQFISSLTQQESISPAQQQFLNTAANVNPQLAMQTAGGLLFDPEQNQPGLGASPTGKLFADLEFAEQSGNTEAVAALRQTIQNQLGPGVDVNFDDVRNMRNDFKRDSAGFEEQQQGFLGIQQLASNPSPANDLGLIFNTLRVLDPGSIVREGEVELTANAGSLAQRVAARFKAVFEGERLTDGQRQDLLQMAETQFGVARDQHVRRIDDARGFATRHGFDVADLVPSHLLPLDFQQSNTSAGAAGGFQNFVSGAGDLAAGAVNALTPDVPVSEPTRGVIQRGNIIQLGNGATLEILD